MRARDFSLADLYTAIDARRQARGLSWAGAAREINRVAERTAARHPISPSTITALKSKRVAEGDGVLQMLLWLERTPESFVPGHPDPDGTACRLQVVDPPEILRFDTRAIYAALNTKRSAHEMAWAQVAAEIGVGTSTLTHLAAGGRTGFPDVVRVACWLNRPVASFTRVAAS